MLKSSECEEKIEDVLSVACVQYGDEVCEVARGVLLQSCRKGRVNKYLQNSGWSLEKYVYHVLDMIVSEQDYVRKIRVERNNEVWESLGNKLLRVARHRLVSWGFSYQSAAALAEDYVHDIVEPILAGDYYYDVKFEAWMLSVLHNHLRKQARESQKFQIVDEITDKLTDNNPSSPELDLIVKQHYAIIVQAIDRLPSVQKQFVLLYYGEERKLEDVAVNMNKTIQQIYGLHRRAKDNLRQILRDFGIE